MRQVESVRFAHVATTVLVANPPRPQGFHVLWERPLSSRDQLLDEGFIFLHHSHPKDLMLHFFVRASCLTDFCDQNILHLAQVTSNACVCARGYRYDTVKTSCIACSIGFYKGEDGNAEFCSPCDMNYTTYGTGAEGHFFCLCKQMRLSVESEQ